MEKSMKIVLGKTAGFCYGVKRAVEQALKEAQDKKEDIYCLGELVHNDQVKKKLESSGVKFIEDIKEVKSVKNSEVIIRAHGVTKEVYKYAEDHNIKLIDLTCPNVLKVHKIAKEASNNGYFIFITGKKDHPENIGTISYCDNYAIIEEPSDTEIALKELKKSGLNKLLLISQTTYSIEKFYLIREKISYLLDKSVKFDIENTICPTTETRQKEAEEMSKKVDCMIIIGGKNSSNTRKLYEISSKNCKNVFFVEDEIDIEKIKQYAKIGIMAGASTPKESIEKIINSCRITGKY